LHRLFAAAAAAAAMKALILYRREYRGVEFHFFDETTDSDQTHLGRTRPMEDSRPLQPGPPRKRSRSPSSFALHARAACTAHDFFSSAISSRRQFIYRHCGEFL